MRYLHLNRSYFSELCFMNGARVCGYLDVCSGSGVKDLF